MGSTVTKIFAGPSSFTVPAGVKKVSVAAVTNQTGLRSDVRGSAAGIIDAISGKVWMWGANSFGQCGNGTSLNNISSPTLVVGGLPAMKTLFSGANSASNTIYGLTQSGALYAWGNNQNGQVGDGTTVGKSSPVLVAGGLSFSLVNNIGGQGVTALTTGGAAYSWGFGTNGQLGDGTAVSKSSPVPVVGGNTYVKLASFPNGSDTVFALKANGQVFAWGDNTTIPGVLGDGTVVNRSSPVLVLGGQTFVDIFPGAGISVGGLTATGQMYLWGQNQHGQCGVGDSVVHSSPTLVLGGLTFLSALVSQIANFAIMGGITPTGQLYMWGQNADGGLGIGSSNTAFAVSSPVLVAGNQTFTKVVANSSSYVVAAGLTPTGQLYMWGNNSHGTLGDGTTVSRSSPTLVVGSQTWADVTIVGDGQGLVAIAVTTSGQVYAWGHNSFSNYVGDGTSVDRSSPTLVLGSHIAAVAPGLSRETFSVTPGASYAIQTGPTYATFGTSIISPGPVDRVVISYEQ